MLRLIDLNPDDQGSDADREASAWIVRLTSGLSSESDHDEFRAWKAQGTEQVDALRRALTDWQRIGVALPLLERAPQLRQTTWKPSALAIAASLALTVGVGQEYWRNWRFDEVTKPGERRLVVLPNGGKMLMRGGTALSLNFQSAHQSIALDRGSVMLSMKHTPNTTFSVKTAGTVYRDIGTEFSVSTFRLGSGVAVSSGEVEAVHGYQKATIKGGQSLQVDVNGVMHFKAHTDLSSELSWVRGRVQFANQPLKVILRSTAADYASRVVFLSSASANKKISASIDLENIDGWIDGLQKSTSIKVHRIAGYTFIY